MPTTRTRSVLLAAALLGGLLLGCSEAPVDAEATLLVTTPEADLDEAQRAQLARATKAKDLLFTQLLGALSSAMQEGGPTAAIPVCKERAPQLAREVSEKTGVEVGRTSWKLRSAANQPPAWLASFLEPQPEEPVVMVGSDGSLAALAPIRMGDVCLKCHGPAERLAEGVGDRLAELYPDDRAKGFAPGALRGWFWMRVSADA